MARAEGPLDVGGEGGGVAVEGRTVRTGETEIGYLNSILDYTF